MTELATAATMTEHSSPEAETPPGACPIDSDHDPARCLHCDLKLSAAQVARGERFCCSGCKRVFELIREGGFSRYYELRSEAGVPASDLSRETYAWLDRLVENASGDLLRLTLDLQGVHCAACVWLLESLFRRQAGGVSLRINPALGQAEIVWNRAGGDLKEWLIEAERFGYRFGPHREGEVRVSRNLVLRLGITAGLAVQVMMFSLAYYFGLSAADGALFTVLGVLEFVFTTLAVVVGGWVFLRSAWRGVRRRVIHLDLPIAAGILLAYAGSTYAYLRHGPEASYFDTVSIFVALMLVGRWLQERVLLRNRNSLLADAGVDCLFTRRRREGTLETIPARDILRGDELWVVPGDLVPVEAIVVGDAGTVSLDWITGESAPRAAEAGSTLPAGAFNAGRTALRLSAQEDFTHSRLQELLRAPRADGAADSRGGWWSRVAAVYVVLVFALAGAGFALWAGHGAEKGLQVAIAILVVTCPCALGLAVPLAQEMVQTALQRRGVFLRNGRFLDRALRVKKIIFDKTGTLTLGRLRLTEASGGALENLTPHDRKVLWNMTARSNHPASRAVARALETAAVPNGTHPESGSPGVVPPDDVEPVTETPGRGLEWRRAEGVYRLGRASFAGAAGASVPVSSSSRGGSVFSRNGRTILRLEFEEDLKEDAVSEIERLHREGFSTYLLSGDREDRVRGVAARLGIPAERVRASVTPEEKAAWVAAVDDEDTLMVGDGINDGPSFEAAWCAATPAVDHPALPARADFYFLGERIDAVGAALAAARRLRTVTRGNLVFAAVYNTAALALCYAGLVGPVVAAVLMPLSSVAVVTLTATRLSGRHPTWMP